MSGVTITLTSGEVDALWRAGDVVDRAVPVDLACDETILFRSRMANLLLKVEAAEREVERERAAAEPIPEPPVRKAPAKKKPAAKKAPAKKKAAAKKAPARKPTAATA